MTTRNPAPALLLTTLLLAALLLAALLLPALLLTTPAALAQPRSEPLPAAAPATPAAAPATPAPAPQTAAAPTATPARPAPASSAAARRARRVIEIDDIVVQGEVQKPEAFYILQRSDLNFKGLEPERSFIPLIIESVAQEPF